MSSFLVLCEGDTRNRWRDGQVCPDVRQGIMAPWDRRLGGQTKGKRRGEETGRGDGEGRKKSGENGREEKTRGDGKGEREWNPPWMEKRAESGNWSEKDDERMWR
ncbi:hypothetical protein TNCV_2552291 [Trichonephila clavipes]|nr:hypothetical protein TNCV_2552291 [Trichonephila clavipes]